MLDKKIIRILSKLNDKLENIGDYNNILVGNKLIVLLSSIIIVVRIMKRFEITLVSEKFNVMVFKCDMKGNTPMNGITSRYPQIM